MQYAKRKRILYIFQFKCVFFYDHHSSLTCLRIYLNEKVQGEETKNMNYFLFLNK